MRVLIVAAAAVVMSGCAAPGREAVFDPVAREASARTGQWVEWIRGGGEDVAAGRAVEDLLNRPLTVEGAVQVALLRDWSLQEAYEGLGVAQAEVVQAGLLKNPVFSASVRFPARPQYGVDVGVEEEFLDVLFLPVRKRLAAAALTAAQARVGEQVLDVAAGVREKFCRLQGALAEKALAETTVEAGDAEAEVGARLRAAGNITELELTLHRSQAAEARLQLEEAEAGVTEAREELARAMGVPDAAERLQVSGELAAIPATGDGDVASLEARAVAGRLLLKAAAADVAAARERAGLARVTGILGGATAGAELVRDPDVETTVGPAVSVPLPIFDQGQGERMHAVAEWWAARDRAAAEEAEVRGAVRVSAARAAAARGRAAYVEHTVLPAEEAALKESVRQYDAMEAGVFELLAAKRGELAAQRELVAARVAYWVAETELQRAVGDFPSEEAPPATQPATLP
ncbi:MAG TPA: TolC family protein [Phycisphaerae bacterium]|nr:TolC family protein [Phycisphaerae bacterium]